MDPRYPFPLPWSPAIAYKGFEDLAFAPGFDDTSSPEYHSYLIRWWLEGSKPLTAEQLQSDMITYFRELAAQKKQQVRAGPFEGVGGIPRFQPGAANLRRFAREAFQRLGYPVRQARQADYAAFRDHHVRVRAIGPNGCVLRDVAGTTASCSVGAVGCGS